MIHLKLLCNKTVAILYTMELCAVTFTGAQALSRAPFGQGTGPILLDDLICNGGETRLTDCFHNGVGVHNCAHNKDAGLRCRAPMPPGIMMASIVPILNPNCMVIYTFALYAVEVLQLYTANKNKKIHK